MLQGAVELGYRRQVTLLTGRMRVQFLGEGVDKQVVCLEGEGWPFNEVAEVMDGGLDGEQFPVEGGVSWLGRWECPTEEGEGLLGAVEDLFEDGTVGDVACVGGQDEGKTGVGKLRQAKFWFLNLLQSEWQYKYRCERIRSKYSSQ